MNYWSSSVWKINPVITFYLIMCNFFLYQPQQSIYIYMKTIENQKSTLFKISLLPRSHFCSVFTTYIWLCMSSFGFLGVEQDSGDWGLQPWNHLCFSSPSQSTYSKGWPEFSLPFSELSFISINYMFCITKMFEEVFPSPSHNWCFDQAFQNIGEVLFAPKLELNKGETTIVTWSCYRICQLKIPPNIFNRLVDLLAKVQVLLVFPTCKLIKHHSPSHQSFHLEL